MKKLLTAILITSSMNLFSQVETTETISVKLEEVSLSQFTTIFPIRNFKDQIVSYLIQDNNGQTTIIGVTGKKDILGGIINIYLAYKSLENGELGVRVSDELRFGLYSASNQNKKSFTEIKTDKDLQSLFQNNFNYLQTTHPNNIFNQKVNERSSLVLKTSYFRTNQLNIDAFNVPNLENSVNRVETNSLEQVNRIVSPILNLTFSYKIFK